ncbi:uncharacterized protein LOC135128307 [Zophobas morio]|uniref:uncharacterized protein LOC135128307 n=1 Tax=Zophobas morio TaxID=2755281 RepID=UPI003082E60A
MERLPVLLLFVLVLTALAKDESKEKKDSPESHSGENKGVGKHLGGHKGFGLKHPAGNDGLGKLFGKDSKEHSDEHSGEGAGLCTSSEESGSKGNKKPKGKGSGIKYSYNPKFGCYLQKEKSQYAVVLAYITYSAAFYDGQTGEVFVFISTETSGVYIPGGVSDKTWLAKKQSFSEYSKNLVPLEDLYKLGDTKGMKITAETITKDLQKKLSKILSSQSRAYKDECKAFAYAMEVASLAHLGRLKGFEQVLDKPVNGLELRGDLQETLGYYKGWKAFFGYFDGEMEAFKQNNIKLDYEQLLNSETEFHLLGYFLEGLAPHSDLVDAIAPHLDDEEMFFEIVAGLGGHIRHSFGGYIYVVSESVGYLHGKRTYESIEATVSGYITYEVGVQDDYLKTWTGGISSIRKTIKKTKLDGKLGKISKILQRMDEEKKWQIGDVDMYEVLKTISDQKLPGNKRSVRKVLKALKAKKGKKH